MFMGVRNTLHYYVLLVWFIIGMAVHCYTDIREQMLYNKVNAFLAAGGVVYGYAYHGLVESLNGMLVTGGIMLLLYLISRGGMGAGDVKLALALGLWLGFWKGLLCLLIAFTVGSAVGLLLYCSGKKKMSGAMPFGPCLCAGATAALLRGEMIIGLYLELFFA